MSSVKLVEVYININDSQKICKKLILEDHLSDIREKCGTIDNALSFAKKVEEEFYYIERENEKDLHLIDRLKNESFNDVIKSTYQYKEIGKASLKLSKEDLVPTTEFIKVVKDAIKSDDPRGEFKKITEEYGQIISTEIILGGRVYFKD